MTARRPIVIVSLPGKSAAETVEQIAIAAGAGADAAEVRLDRWGPEAIASAKELFPAALPLLATLRSRAEGGEGPDDPAARRTELRRLAQLPFRWIDLEYERDRSVADELPPVGTLGRVVSCHLPAERAGEWSHQWLELARCDGIGKLVVPASVAMALDEIVPAVEGRQDGTVAVFTVGPSGALLRALSRRLGAPIVFSSLPDRAGATPVEPSQVPIDRLLPFLSAPGDPPLFAVVGHPISHSRSPAVHTAWMRADRRDGIYVPLEFTDDEEFVRALPLLAENGFRGVNVTQPFKFAAFEAATEAGPSAEVCRTANCLTLGNDRVLAENTDLAAVLRRLEELRASGRWNGKRVTVVGAGGAARATLAAARELGALATVVDRRPEQAIRVAREFGATPLSNASSPPEGLVVHATSAGRPGSGPLSVPLVPLLARDGYLLDWVYRPDEPRIAAEAKAAGAVYEDGWRLFVYQAAASYAIWWGEEPSEEAVQRTIEEGACTA
jgi:shikimate dehydrogenase/3-dehydroquinate dehydratase type I